MAFELERMWKIFSINNEILEIQYPQNKATKELNVSQFTGRKKIIFINYSKFHSNEILIVFKIKLIKQESTRD